jgi:lipopolysaccharide transport system permease protein
MTLSQYFQLVDVRARMALRADAARDMLGYFWWILEPLLFVGVFYVVFDVILESGRADFLVFLMCGKLAFVWFSKSVSAASNSIVSAYGLVGQLNIPKSLFPVAVVQESLYKQLSVFLLLFCVLWAYHYPVTMGWIWLVPVVFVNYLMIVACSLIGACLVCFMRDFSKVITLFMTLLLFTSGIFWDVNDIGDPHKAELVLALNPMAFILNAYRQVLMFDTVPDLVHLAKIGLASIALIVMTIAFMRKFSQYLALKVLTG